MAFSASGRSASMIALFSLAAMVAAYILEITSKFVVAIILFGIWLKNYGYR
jgi:hypothetical protein